MPQTPSAQIPPRFDEWLKSPPNPDQLKAAEDNVVQARTRADQVGQKLQAAKAPPRFDEWQSKTTAPRFDEWSAKPVPAVKPPRSHRPPSQPVATINAGVGFSQSTGLLGEKVEPFAALRSLNAQPFPVDPEQSAYRAQKEAVRQQVRKERNPQTLMGKVGRGVERLMSLNDMVTKGQLPEDLRPEANIVEEQTDQRLAAQARANTPEMVAERTARGEMSATRRAIDDPVTRLGASSAKLLGGISSLAGIAPNRLSEYLNKTGNLWEEGTQLPPLTPKGEEVVRGLPEKAVAMAGDVVGGIVQLVAMKKASGLSMAKIMGVETALKTSDLPLKERTQRVAEAVAMGRVLDSHLGRAASAGLFGAPTAVQTGTEVLKGNMDPLEAVISTGIQASVGGVMGGKGIGGLLSRAPKESHEILRNQQVVGAPTVPEGRAAISGQMEAMRNGERDAVLITPGTPRPPIPPGYRTTKTSEGLFIYDPKFISEKGIKAMVADGTHGQLLGNLAPKPEPGEPVATVVARDAEGKEVQSSVVPPEVAEAQANELAKQHPEAKIEIGDENLAAKVIAERLSEPIKAEEVIPKSEPETKVLETQGPTHEGGQPIKKVNNDAQSAESIQSGEQVRKTRTASKAESLQESGNKIPLRQSTTQQEGTASNRSLDTSRVEPWQMTQRQVADYNQSHGRPLTKEGMKPFAVGRKLPDGAKVFASDHAMMAESPDGRNYQMGGNTAESQSRAYQRLQENGFEVEWQKARGQTDYHKEAIQKALAEGKSVPPEVLADYPDLQKLSTSKVASPLALTVERSPVPETKSSVPTEPIKAAEPPSIKAAGEGERLPDTTSIKNAATKELRADLGLIELEGPERKSFEKSIENALAKGLDKRAEQIADDVISGKETKGLDDEEGAAIQHRMRELENEWEDLYAKNQSDPKLTDIEKRLDNLTKATNMGGTAPARALSFRRSMTDKNFKLISLIRQAKEAKGRDLSSVERARYEGIVKERDQAVADRDAALEQLHSKRLQQDLDRTARQRARKESKETLDKEAVMIRQNIVAEFARLKSQQSGVHSLGGLGSLDPEGVITRELLKYARNRAHAVVGLKAEALIDEAHRLVSDFGISRRQVAEVLSGYGRLPVDARSEAARKLADIRSEINSLLKAEDVAAGKRTLRQEGPKREFVRNQNRFKQLVKQEAEWERKFNERDFEPKPQAEPYPYNSDVRRAEDRVRIAEAKFKREMDRAAPGHQFRNASGILKAWVLSGPQTQAMNIAGTAGYQAFREVARLPAAIGDVVWSQTGARVFGNKGQRSITGPSPSAMLDSVIQSGKVGGREFMEIMKHGATKEQMERHQYQEIDFGVNTGKKAIDSGVKLIELAHNGIFRLMSASDRVFYQGTYKRNLIDRATVQAKNEGVSNVRERTRELVAEAERTKNELHSDADHDALVSTFNNDNALSSKVKRARSAVVNPKSLMSKKNAQRLNAAENFAMDFILPFDRTPTNVVSRIVEASPLGYFKNAGQLISAAMRKSMPVEHQRQMMQTFGNATAGSALMALGWYLGDKAKGMVTVDNYDVFLKIPGLPKINLRAVSPTGNIFAMGARLRAAYDKEGATAGDYAKPILQEVTNVPVLKATSPIVEAAHEPERSIPKTAAKFAGMAIPFGGAVRFAGQAIDPAEKRYPNASFKEQFQKNFPKWRESLPASSSRLLGNKYTKAVKEVERLGVTLKGAMKQPDETPEEFKVREASDNEVVRQAIERVVALRSYDKLSDKLKIYHIKLAKERALQSIMHPETPQQEEIPELLQDEPTVTPTPRSFRTRFAQGARP